MIVSTTIDLTGHLGPVRSQGQRCTCLAFALSDLHRHKHQVVDPLSPEYLYRAAASITAGWRPNGGLPLAAGIAAVNAPGQPHEAHCPYQPQEPGELPPAIPSGSFPLFTASGLNGSISEPNLVAALKAGRPMGLVICLTESFYRPVNGLVDFPSPLAPTHCSHAVIAAGVGTDATGATYFLIRNSWGDSWGVHGNAWIPGAYFQTHGIRMFEVN